MCPPHIGKCGPNAEGLESAIYPLADLASMGQMSATYRLGSHLCTQYGAHSPHARTWNAGMLDASMQCVVLHVAMVVLSMLTGRPVEHVMLSRTTRAAADLAPQLAQLPLKDSTSHAGYSPQTPNLRV